MTIIPTQTTVTRKEDFAIFELLTKHAEKRPDDPTMGRYKGGIRNHLEFVEKHLVPHLGYDPEKCQQVGRTAKLAKRTEVTFREIYGRLIAKRGEAKGTAGPVVREDPRVDILIELVHDLAQGIASGHGREAGERVAALVHEKLI